jgi:hypothetical protein
VSTITCCRCGRTEEAAEAIPPGWSILLTQGSRYICDPCHDDLFGPVMMAEDADEDERRKGGVE